MTIKELMEALSKFNWDTPVVVRGYEGGYNDVTLVKAESIQLNVNTQHYYGAHGRTDEQYEPVPGVPFTDVVYLGGDNHMAQEKKVVMSKEEYQEMKQRIDESLKKFGL